MKIAVMGSRGYPSTYSGYETFVRHFIPHARERGHEVLVYCRWKQAGQTAWTVDDGVECRYTRGIETKSLSTLSFGLTASFDVRRRDVDAALVLNSANGLWLPLLHAAKVPAAINVDGVEWRRGKWGLVGKTLHRAGARTASRRAEALVADSRAIAEIWSRKYGRRPEFIPYGASIVSDDAGDELEALGIPPGGYVLTVARLVPENNVEMVIDALEAIPERPPWVVVGEANYRNELEAKLRKLSERPDVWWLGHVSSDRLLEQLWRHCAVYVHGHSVGGTNPSLLQALGAGAPTLALDSVFNREVIGEDGEFFAPAPAALAGELERFMGSSELRAKQSALGPARVTGRYSWPEVCDRYLALLEDLAAGRRREPLADAEPLDGMLKSDQQERGGEQPAVARFEVTRDGR